MSTPPSEGCFSGGQKSCCRQAELAVQLCIGQILFDMLLLLPPVLCCCCCCCLPLLPNRIWLMRWFHWTVDSFMVSQATFRCAPFAYHMQGLIATSVSTLCAALSSVQLFTHCSAYKTRTCPTLTGTYRLPNSPLVLAPPLPHPTPPGRVQPPKRCPPDPGAHPGTSSRCNLGTHQGHVQVGGCVDTVVAIRGFKGTRSKQE
jgi:hypothetical protein